MEKYNILVTDDVEDVRLLIIEMISPVCNKSYEAENGRQMIKMLLDNSEIQVILTDIEMPEMDGLEATEYIRSHFTSPKKEIPIIAITAYNSRPFAERCMKAGVNHVISKPFTDAEIVKAIQKFMKK